MLRAGGHRLKLGEREGVLALPVRNGSGLRVSRYPVTNVSPRNDPYAVVE
jgi:hypothetical protein